MKRPSAQCHVGTIAVDFQAEAQDYSLLTSLCSLQHGLAPSYLSSELHRVADASSRQRLRSASTAALLFPKTRLSTVGDRAFPMATARAWNDLPPNVTSAPSLSTFKQRLKTTLFSRRYVDN